MIKKIVTALLFLLPLMTAAKEVYFYSNGKKILLEEKFSDPQHSSETPVYHLFKGSTVKANRNIFVKIPGTPSPTEAEKWCESNGLTLIKQYSYIPQWYLVSYSGDTIKKSVELVEKKIVQQAEPSFYLPLELKTYVSADEHFFKQWHLHNWGGTADGLTGEDHAHVANAWTLMKHFTGKIGNGIKLAIVDDGFDLDHEDLSGKFLPGYDFGDKDDLPYPGPQDAHGTCCAGVAGAKTDNDLGVAGACPDCMIIPIRMNMTGYSLDSIAIESFEWAANAGADIISNSWGPTDGGGAVDMGQPLKDLVLNLTTTGRNGLGIIILFAAGNGGESIEGDGFASNPNVFAIGASTAAGKRSSYSDFGTTLDFLAPSNDTDSGGDGWSGSYVDGIWTTDNTNGGYNPGQLAGDTTGKYVSEFGGTSSACPLGAGITGLVLAANPALTKDQVYEIFKMTADKVSKGAVNPTENDYDANGFSTHYGWGRLNACEAVRMAFDMAGKDVGKIVCGEEIDEKPADNDVKDDSDTTANDNDIKNDGEVPDGSNMEDDDISPVGRRTDDGCSCSFLNI